MLFLYTHENDGYHGMFAKEGSTMPDYHTKTKTKRIYHRLVSPNAQFFMDSNELEKDNKGHRNNYQDVNSFLHNLHRFIKFIFKKICKKNPVSYNININYNNDHHDNYHHNYHHYDNDHYNNDNNQYHQYIIHHDHRRTASVGDCEIRCQAGYECIWEWCVCNSRGRWCCR